MGRRRRRRPSAIEEALSSCYTSRTLDVTSGMMSLARTHFEIECIRDRKVSSKHRYSGDEPKYMGPPDDGQWPHTIGRRRYLVSLRDSCKVWIECIPIPASRHENLTRKNTPLSQLQLYTPGKRLFRVEQKPVRKWAGDSRVLIKTLDHSKKSRDSL